MKGIFLSRYMGLAQDGSSPAELMKCLFFSYETWMKLAQVFGITSGS